MVIKVSLILSIPSGIRTIDMIDWAEALVLRDVETKCNLALANTTEDISEEIARKIRDKIDGEVGITVAAISKSLGGKKGKPELIKSVLKKLEERGEIFMREEKHKINGRQMEKWYSIN